MRGFWPLRFMDIGRKPAPVELAQDAAGSHKQYQNSKSAYGAFCLAVSAQPSEQIEAAFRDMRTIGRASALPRLLGGLSLQRVVLVLTWR